ncbi:MAG: HD domain-containing protein [Lachnospiraceae bacterium]|nr:HD domain-containing protein [Lachnospiraceae bacterium]
MENTAKIRELSTPQVSEVRTAADYSMNLKHNFIIIGKLAAENRQILSEELFPYLEPGAEISQERIDSLGDFCDALLDAYNLDNLDPAIHDVLSQKLFADARASRDVRSKNMVLGIDREITSCYTMMNITQRLISFPEIAEAYRKRGFSAADQIAELIEPEAFAALPDDECRKMVLINARYMWSLYEGGQLSEEETRHNYNMLLKELLLADDPEYINRLPDYDWRYHKFRTLSYISMLLDYNNRRGMPGDIVEAIADHVAEMDRMWHSDPEYFANLMEENELHLHVLRADYLSGRMDKTHYHRNMLALYDMRDPNDYGLSGMTLNVMLSTEYILSLDRESVPESEKHVLSRFYADSLRYAFNMSGKDSLSYMLEFLSMLMTNFIEIPGVMTFEDFCLSCIAALHPPTYVHSTMVAQFTRCITRHLLKLHPELFDDVFRMLKTDDEDTVLSFAFHAARCHDFGKILITDTIMVYGRRLLDTEFELIKKHPGAGADIMECYKSTARYANAARAHHIWYDGSAGYPDDFDVSDLPERVIIDIVTCADCLDAATDTVGRSYSRGKTLFEFSRELSEGAGTRYAPWLPELFRDKNFLADLSYLLSNGRRKNYERVYDRLKSVYEESLTYMGV